LLVIEGEYAAVDPEFLGLESIWRSRALIGLALAEAALKNAPASAICFAWLEQGSVPAEVRDQLPYWRLRAFWQQGLYEQALAYAQQQIDHFAGLSMAARVRFCAGLVQLGWGQAAEGAAAAPSQRLGLLGLTGLIKLRQRTVASQLLERYEMPGGEPGFHLAWIRGEQRFAAAEQTKSPEGYEEAAQLLQSALQLPGAHEDLEAAALCRLQLAWCRYRLGEREAAARLFEQSSADLRAMGDAQAADAAWMAFVAYYALSREAPRFVASAINVLQQLKRDFPEGEYAKRAGYYLSRLEAKAASPAERISTLAEVPRDSDHYLDALYEIASLRSTIWSESPVAARPAALDELRAAVDRFLSSAGNQQFERRLRACLLLVAAAMQTEPQPAETVERYLRAAQESAQQLPTENSAVAEYHYRALEWALARDDPAQRDRHADWLVEHARGSSYEQAALIQAAKAADTQLRAAAPAEQPALREEAYRLYQRLASLLGQTPQQLAASQNARVAHSRLAELALEMGRATEAAEFIERLIAAGGDQNRDYLRRAGLAHFAAGQYAASLPYWRTLLTGLPRGGEDWYEAKYYQLAALQKVDPATFREAAQQFRVLYPAPQPPVWQRKFAELLNGAGLE
jgi:tetratricopeptide (TPR) repeat protein